jgi:hypothetical protein
MRFVHPYTVWRFAHLFDVQPSFQLREVLNPGNDLMKTSEPDASRFYLP